MLDRVVLKYDLAQFPFSGLVADHVGMDLERLHERYSYDRLRRGTEQATDLHRLLYAIGPAFFSLYHDFLRAVVQPTLASDLIYQRIPNFRFQLPGNVAVRGFHRDRDDGHQDGEINFWVPLTTIHATSAVWIESRDGAGDFTPALVSPGEVLAFDGCNLEHGNQVNESETTRVNFDFRVIKRHLFRASDDRSMYREVRFDIGHYYEIL